MSYAQLLSHSSQSITSLHMRANSLQRHIYWRLLHLKLKLQSTNKSHVIAVTSIIILSPIFLLLVWFVTPQKTAFSFAEQTCITQPLALPRSVKQSNSQLYSVDHSPIVAVGSTPLFSHRSCLSLAQLPSAGQTESVVLSVGPLQKKIQVSLPELPALTAPKLTEPVAPNAVLQFNLSSPDATFSYSLVTENTVKCEVLDSTVSCPISELKVTQGSSYDYTILRSLADQSEPIVKGAFSVREPLLVLSASVQPNAVIYDDPQSISIELNKPVAQNGTVTLTDSSGNTIATSLVAENQTLTVNLDEPLLRKTSYILTLQDSIAADGAFLNEPHTLQFETSGGPQVQGVSIGNYDVSQSATVTLTFDSPLGESAANFISVVVGGSVISSNITVSGNTVRINPTSNLPACTAFTVRVADGMTNSYGISGGSAWSTNSRTTCKQIFSIGTSVQGRAITAFRFGSGATKILFVGGMHGDEKSSVRTLNSFIDDLERNYPSIPADKTIVVIPNTNPDGYAASTRVNASNVDLNRNFPTFDWVTEAHLPRGVYLPNGGGVTALSEPEASALASYTSALSPRVTLTFHATGRAVFANGSGDSQAITSLYAEKSGFSALSQTDEDSFFEYATTGEYENWMHDKLGLPAILVELASNSNNEFTRQKPALWAMLEI